MAAHTDILSLFSGVGGLDLGVAAALRRLGAAPRTVCMVEGEAFGAACLASQMEAGALAACPVWSDVRTFDARAWRGLVDGVVGGFPCQDLSNAGTRRGLEGERSGLFFELVRVVRDVGPRWVFLENVASIVVRGLDAVLGEMAALGFDAEWRCLRASDVGAPHRRDRWFCLAHRDGGRLEGKRRAQREPELSRRDEPDGCNVPRWPPGPNDRDAWRCILAERPDLAPATQSGLCRMADGIPARVDRLRALGNAVVPEQAEAAFLELWRRR